ERTHARQHAAPLKQGDVAVEGEEVELCAGMAPAERLEDRKQHDRVPESIELDAQDTARARRLRVERRWRGREQRGYVAAEEASEDAVEAEEDEADRQPDPLVHVARVVEVHRAAREPYHLLGGIDKSSSSVGSALGHYPSGRTTCGSAQAARSR